MLAQLMQIHHPAHSLSFLTFLPIYFSLFPAILLSGLEPAILGFPSAWFSHFTTHAGMLMKIVLSNSSMMQPIALHVWEYTYINMLLLPSWPSGLSVMCSRFRFASLPCPSSDIILSISLLLHEAFHIQQVWEDWNGPFQCNMAGWS